GIGLRIATHPGDDIPLGPGRMKQDASRAFRVVSRRMNTGGEHVGQLDGANPLRRAGSRVRSELRRRAFGRDVSSEVNDLQAAVKALHVAMADAVRDLGEDIREGLRGETLRRTDPLVEALGEAGVEAYGLAPAAGSADAARARGFTVYQEGPVEHLARLPDGQLAGVVALQVAEHFSPAGVEQLFVEALRALSPGGLL